MQSIDVVEWFKKENFEEEWKKYQEEKQRFCELLNELRAIKRSIDKFAREHPNPGSDNRLGEHTKLLISLFYVENSEDKPVRNEYDFWKALVNGEEVSMGELMYFLFGRYTDNLNSLKILERKGDSLIDRFEGICIEEKADEEVHSNILSNDFKDQVVVLANQFLEAIYKLSPLANPMTAFIGSLGLPRRYLWRIYGLDNGKEQKIMDLLDIREVYYFDSETRLSKEEIKNNVGDEGYYNLYGNRELEFVDRLAKISYTLFEDDYIDLFKEDLATLKRIKESNNKELNRPNLSEEGVYILLHGSILTSDWANWAYRLRESSRYHQNQLREGSIAKNSEIFHTRWDVWESRLR